jgi:hypothetical protein
MGDWPELLFREGEPTAMSGAPAGGHAAHPVYDASNLPGSGWEWYRKTGATRMVQVGGPCTVVTVTGPHPLPVGWRGYLAVDSEGHPYPIADEVFRASYEPAGEPT